MVALSALTGPGADSERGFPHHSDTVSFHCRRRDFFNSPRSQAATASATVGAWQGRGGRCAPACNTEGAVSLPVKGLRLLVDDRGGGLDARPLSRLAVLLIFTACHCLLCYDDNEPGRRPKRLSGALSGFCAVTAIFIFFLCAFAFLAAFPAAGAFRRAPGS